MIINMRFKNGTYLESRNDEQEDLQQCFILVEDGAPQLQSWRSSEDLIQMNGSLTDLDEELVVIIHVNQVS